MGARRGAGAALSALGTEAWQAIRPFFYGRHYRNFQTADESEERIRSAYGDNFDRVVSVKNRYDPANLFRQQPEHPSSISVRRRPPTNRDYVTWRATDQAKFLSSADGPYSAGTFAPIRRKYTVI